MSAEVISLEASLTSRHEGIIASSYELIAESERQLGYIGLIYSGQLAFDYTGLDLHPELRDEGW